MTVIVEVVRYAHLTRWRACSVASVLERRRWQVGKLEDMLARWLWGTPSSAR